MWREVRAARTYHGGALVNNEPTGQFLYFSPVSCSVAEQSALGTQCVSQGYAKIMPLFLFGDWIQFGVRLDLSRRIPVPVLIYDPVQRIITGWRMAMMLTSPSLQHFRVGSRFFPSTVDDLQNLLESAAEEGTVERLQQDFKMDTAEFADFVDFWEAQRPDPSVFLGWLGGLQQGSHERFVLCSALRYALSEGDIKASLALIAQLDEDATTGDYCSDDMTLDGFWPEIGEG